jgi:hypothetical protein
MSVNTENYTDSKGAQAHLGFMLLLILDLLSKDSINTSQSISSVFISVAIPFLLVSLTLLPGENDDMEDLKPWQLKAGLITLLSGHCFGLLAITCILWGINAFAGLVFLMSSLLAFFVFSFHVYSALGEEGREALKEVFGWDSENA